MKIVSLILITRTLINAVNAEHIAEMWMAITEKQRVANKGITQKGLAETLKTSVIETNRASSSAQITRAEQDICMSTTTDGWLAVSCI